MNSHNPSQSTQGKQPDLELGRLGLGFLSPETECNYRDWRLETTASYWRFAALLGAICTGLLMPLVYANDSETLEKLLPLILPTALAGTLYFLLAPTKKMRWLGMPLFAAIIGLYGAGIAWHRHEIAIYDSLDSNILHAAGVVVLNIFVAFGIGRVTPKWAWFGALPGMSVVIYFAVTDYQAGLISEQAFRASCGMVAVGILFGGLSILFIERNLRASFAQQRVIARQQLRLESTQSAIRRYIPPSVAEKIIAGNTEEISEPKRVRVTILFADLVGFTSVADRVEPEVMSQMLNEYLSAMSDIVENHSGTLNEFAGDGVMAIWGAPDALLPADQARNAIKAAEVMHTTITELNISWKKLGLDEPLLARIGINTGVASVGSYGSQGRSTYSAIGLQTNIASRMESNAPVGGILLSGSTYELVKEEVPCKLFGEVECKGVHFPIKAYVPCRV